MAAKNKVIYFTAGDVATTAEKADIQKLNELAVSPYDVGVRSAVRPMSSGGPLEAADYVAGTIPTAYEDVPVIDPDNPPEIVLPPTKLIVTNGDTAQVTTLDGTATYADATIVVANSAITRLQLPANTTTNTTGGYMGVNDQGGVAADGTANVFANGTCNAVLEATACIVKNAAEVTVGGNKYTFEVSGGAIRGITVTPAA